MEDLLIKTASQAKFPMMSATHFIKLPTSFTDLLKFHSMELNLSIFHAVLAENLNSTPLPQEFLTHSV